MGRFLTHSSLFFFYNGRAMDVKYIIWSNYIVLLLYLFFFCYSVGSLNCGSTISGFTTGSRHESVRSKRFSVWQGPSAIKLLYNLLLEPMEDELPEEGAEIMLVLDSTLFMVPWAMLKGSCNPEIFSERYVVCTYINIIWLQGFLQEEGGKIG